MLPCIMSVCSFILILVLILSFSHYFLPSLLSLLPLFMLLYCSIFLLWLLQSYIFHINFNTPYFISHVSIFQNFFQYSMYFPSPFFSFFLCIIYFSVLFTYDIFSLLSYAHIIEAQSSVISSHTHTHRCKGLIKKANKMN